MAKTQTIPAITQKVMCRFMWTIGFVTGASVQALRGTIGAIDRCAIYVSSGFKFPRPMRNSLSKVSVSKRVYIMTPPYRVCNIQRAINHD